MARLTTGEAIPDFTFNTPFESGCTLAETANRVKGKTALVFLRYYGCTLCQYDMHRYAQAADEIAATGGQLLVALQSDPAKLAAQMKPGDLPYDLVCDPEQALYRQFEIAPAPSKLKMADFATVKKIAKATAGGFKHGDYEGDELQLPAVFVLDNSLRLAYVHYGVSAADVPTPEALAELLR